MSRPTRSAWSRRGVVTAGLVGGTTLAATLGGCDLDDLTGDGSGPPGGVAAPADDPDQVLVDGVLAGIDARLATLTSVKASPALRAVLAPLVDMHTAHRAVLDPDTTPSATATPSPTGRPAVAGRVLTRTRAAETRHHTALVEAAAAARSGALARLLASMSASVTQHLAVLPAAVP